MAEKIINGVRCTARFSDERNATIYVQRAVVVWRDGRWADDNRGRNYLNHSFREQLVKEFNLK